MPNSSLVRSYAAPPAPGNPRATEAWALTRLALRMKDSRERADPEEMLAAVRVNWRLWTILQAELLDPDSPLPDDLRANVLSLAQFVDKRTIDVISHPKPEKLDALIAINRALAGGLYAQPGASARDGDVGAAPGGSDRLGEQTLAVSA